MDVLDDENQMSLIALSKTEDLRYFIGDRNKAYYLDTWQSFDHKSLKVSLNGSAFLFGAFWMAYRKMNFGALSSTYFFAILMFIVIAFNVNLYFFVGFYALFSIYLGLFGNWHYRNMIVKTLQPIKAKQMDRDFEVQAIAKEGGSYYGNSVALLFYWVFLGLLILAFAVFLKDISNASKVSALIFFLLAALYSTQKFR